LLKNLATAGFILKNNIFWIDPGMGIALIKTGKMAGIFTIVTLQ